MHQESLSIIAEVIPGHEDELGRLLGSISERNEGSGQAQRASWNIIPFELLDGVHFARLFLVPQASDRTGERLPGRLVMLTNVDAPVDHHVFELASEAAEGLDTLFGHCTGYPQPHSRTRRSRVDFLQANTAPNQVFYVNTNGRSVERVRSEERLRLEIEKILDSRDFSGMAPSEVRDAIVHSVSDAPDMDWALHPPTPPDRKWLWRQRADLVLGILVAILLAPILLVLAPVFLLVLYRKETSDKPDRREASAETISALRSDDDFGTQNQIIAMGEFKPGLFRRYLSRGLLAVASFAVRHIYNSGSLSGLNTIHFARWTMIDNNRRLIFSSNYDGSLESYMSDFIDKAAWGLNAIFSHGEGFPTTSFLFCRGIRDEQAYKRFLPTRQVRSQVFYQGYPELSAKNLANNSAISAGLIAAHNGQMTIEDTRIWLRRFGVGNKLPPANLVVRLLDSIPWDKICRFEKS